MSSQQKPAATAAVVSAGGQSAVRLPIVTLKTSEIALIKKIVWNEALAYIRYYRDKSNADALSQTVRRFFTPDVITDAKKLLVCEFQAIAGAKQFVTERRNSTARPAHEAEIDDIIGILEAADLQHALDGYLFVASGFDQMPKFGPEEINIGVVVDRQVHMQAAIQDLNASVQQIVSGGGSLGGIASDVVVQKAVDSVSHGIEQKLSDFNSDINARLEHLSAVCSQLADSVTSRATEVQSAPSMRSMHPMNDNDRSLNIVMYGVPEDRSVAVWRKTAVDALLFTAGHHVEISDLFRVGRFTVGKVRPIIVKLRTVWDKRVILSSCSKLKGFTQAKIFIAPDEPLLARRGRMLQRIKVRAERDNKLVAVSSGVLSVDGVNVFSLSDGKLTP